MCRMKANQNTLLKLQLINVVQTLEMQVLIFWL